MDFPPWKWTFSQANFVRNKQFNKQHRLLQAVKQATPLVTSS